jgi:hypothetical protein
MVQILSLLVAAFALVAPALGDGPGVEQALAESPFFAHSNVPHSYEKRNVDDNPVSGLLGIDDDRAVQDGASCKAGRG